MPSNFEYFYGGEAEQFTFFRIPKVLFSDKRFQICQQMQSCCIA